MFAKKSKARRVWDFLWNSDSPASWLADLLIAFLLVRFVIFPVLGFALNSDLPLVVVESGSMQHNGADFNQWWNEKGEWYEKRGISKEQFSKWYFKKGLDKGDIIVTKGKGEYESYGVGEVVIFRTSVQPTPIIHRLVVYNNSFHHFETKGDNNPLQLPYEEKVYENQIVSEAYFRVPKIGWIKLALVEAIRAVSK